MAPSLLLFMLMWGSLVRGLKAENVELSGTKESHTIIHHKCKGGNLTLNEPTANATVLHVFVFLGRETLASTSVPATGMFEIPQKRLTIHNNGRVTLTNLTSDDLGRYRVEVQAEDKITNNITLIIKEPPTSADGELFVMKNALSDTNSIRLMCGAFTTLGFPPVSAVWKDPAGRTLSSDGFKDEYFYLDVPADTADSGDYCCQLDCRAPDFCCLDDQSPLRSCATIPVHTDRKVEVTTDDKMSSGNLTQAIAYLVHRQARCDQLDTYITKVETLQVDMLKGIENMRNTTTDARVQLERETNHKLWNFQLQMDSNVSKVMESCNVSQQQLLTTVSDKLLELETKLNKGLVDLHNASFTATLTSNVQTLTNLTSKTELRVSKLEKKLSAIHNTLNRLETRTNTSLEAIRSNMSAIYKATPKAQCLLKAGYVWYLEACFKLSTNQENYVTAKAKCEADGAHLYDVRSPDLDEQQVRFAIKQARLSLSIIIWLGGNDLEVEGDYRWSDGTPLSSSSKLWGTGQPDNYDGGQDCIVLYVTDVKFALYDDGCSSHWHYLCRYDV